LIFLCLSPKTWTIFDVCFRFMGRYLDFLLS
jgi:hypothetical protein